MSSRLNPTNFGYQNFYSGLLTSDITSGTLTLPLDTVPTPTSGILVIDPNSSTNREVILYTSKGASNVVCPSDGRGYSGTSAVAHLTGTQLIMAPVDKWFTALASGELSNDPLRTELFYDYVASGCVWSGDSYGATKNGSMTSGVIYINGRRLTLVAVTAHVFTASKDTYVDASDNGDGTALLTYTEVTNNAASPALATSNLRLGIIVTGASNIAAATSVNQGNLGATLLPLISGRILQGTDSLGNSVYPSVPPHPGNPASATIATAETTASTSFTDLATVGPQVTVRIGKSGCALVSIRTTGASNAASGQGWKAGINISGATTVAAADPYTIGVINQEVVNCGNILSGTFLITGLTPGLTTFKLQYVILGSATGTFTNRLIAVEPR